MFQEHFGKKKTRKHEFISATELPTAMPAAYISGAAGMAVDNSYWGGGKQFIINCLIINSI